MNALTAKQAETFKTANTKIIAMGGAAMITSRNRDEAVRQSLKTEGTYYWALAQAYQIMSSINVSDKFTDKYCNYLLNIINA